MSAVDHKTGCVLKQRSVDGKINEHKAALKFLNTLVLEGRVVVADEMFTHRDFCQQAADSGGDYFFPVKENNPSLLRDIRLNFKATPAAFPPYAQRKREAVKQNQRLTQIFPLLLPEYKLKCSTRASILPQV